MANLVMEYGPQVADVSVHLKVEILFVNFNQWLHDYHSGVIDQAIKAAAGFAYGLHGRIDLLLLVDVQPHALDVFDCTEFRQVLVLARAWPLSAAIVMNRMVQVRSMAFSG